MRQDQTTNVVSGKVFGNLYEGDTASLSDLRLYACRTVSIPFEGELSSSSFFGAIFLMYSWIYNVSSRTVALTHHLHVINT